MALYPLRPPATITLIALTDPGFVWGTDWGWDAPAELAESWPRGLELARPISVVSIRGCQVPNSGLESSGLEKIENKPAKPP